MIYQQPRRSPESENGGHKWPESDDAALEEIQHAGEGLYVDEAGLPGAKETVGVVAETGDQVLVTEVESRDPDAAKEKLRSSFGAETSNMLTREDIEKETAGALALVENFIQRGEAGTDILKADKPNPGVIGERFLVRSEDLNKVATILAEQGGYDCRKAGQSLLHCGNGRINLVFEAGKEKS